MRTWQFAFKLNEVAEKNGWIKVVSIQNEYSLLYRQKIIPYAPLLARPANATRSSAEKSAHFEPTLSDADKTTISRVEELANERGVKMNQIALAWMQSKVVSPIVGISSVKPLEEAGTGFELSEEEKKYLEDAYIVPKLVHGHA
ncbi:hypothetical protein DXG03_002050 [Asterophora parasitica]|uniref:NADP-dependent oxidoreductase domain-containing protein n=1 Tax=Asterophora parasitica TaxID=117018 RepID=A0A9P7G4R5_9AGAR|nr:hypothetical protein DXG03_002050 [Asterophora parasitica]